MGDATRPHSRPHSEQRSRQLLGEIADTLGMSVEELQAGPSPFRFHTDVDATQWFLVPGADGLAAVRQVSANMECPATADEPVAEFLSHNLGTARGDALAAMINHLLLASMR